jgi:hypothetical protein
LHLQALALGLDVRDIFGERLAHGK